MRVEDDDKSGVAPYKEVIDSVDEQDEKYGGKFLKWENNNELKDAMRDRNEKQGIYIEVIYEGTEEIKMKEYRHSNSKVPHHHV